MHTHKKTNKEQTIINRTYWNSTQIISNGMPKTLTLIIFPFVNFCFHLHFFHLLSFVQMSMFLISSFVFRHLHFVWFFLSPLKQIELEYGKYLISLAQLDRCWILRFSFLFVLSLTLTHNRKWNTILLDIFFSRNLHSVILCFIFSLLFSL